MINIKGNPWLGLNTYTESDKLYGRNSEIVEVTDIILNNVQTIIYGRSGIGKSSLLQAGVFPRLRYEDFFRYISGWSIMWVIHILFKYFQD